MEGITVLTEATGEGLKELFTLFLVLCALVLFSVLIVVIVLDWLENKFNLKDWVSKTITAVVIISAMCFCCFIYNLCNNFLVDKFNSYEITIDDSVSFNEFNAKYKVLKQDGQIFTVVEREVDENETNP